MQGYIEDGVKAIVYLIPLIYIVVKRNKLKIKYFWLVFTGLFLLFLGHLLDFLDEFAYVRNLPLQDFFEDVAGFTLGFGLFILGIYLNLKKSK